MGGLADQFPLEAHQIIDVTHPVVIDRRRREWPHVASFADKVKSLSVYGHVKATGLPNMLGAKIPLVTQLKCQNWHNYVTGRADDDFILRGVKYGFPLQYVGGPLRGRKSTMSCLCY